PLGQYGQVGQRDADEIQRISQNRPVKISAAQALVPGFSGENQGMVGRGVDFSGKDRFQAAENLLDRPVQLRRSAKTDGILNPGPDFAQSPSPLFGEIGRAS